MPSAELSRRVDKVVGYPPLSELDRFQRREFHEGSRPTASRICQGKWQAAILEAEESSMDRVCRPPSCPPESTLRGKGGKRRPCHRTGRFDDDREPRRQRADANTG
jgi:hypothetical protein